MGPLMGKWDSEGWAREFLSRQSGWPFPPLRGVARGVVVPAASNRLGTDGKVSGSGRGGGTATGRDALGRADRPVTTVSDLLRREPIGVGRDACSVNARLQGGSARHIDTSPLVHTGCHQHSVRADYWGAERWFDKATTTRIRGEVRR